MHFCPIVNCIHTMSCSVFLLLYHNIVGDIHTYLKGWDEVMI